MFFQTLTQITTHGQQNKDEDDKKNINSNMLDNWASIVNSTSSGNKGIRLRTGKQ